MPPSPAVYYNASGRAVTLLDEIGRGGNGAVYTTKGDDRTLAKIYHLANRTENQRRKLEYLIPLYSADRSRTLAWPHDLLYDRPSGAFAGLLMPKIQPFTEIHVLYSTPSRLREFPQADWRFLIGTARNLAAIIHQVHSDGMVVGDINEGNILVFKDSTVKLVDVDSFQVEVNGRALPCEGGVPLFTPPELHGKVFANTPRTPNHDAFGLAVMIFQLLFMGRHPYAGRFKGGTADLTIEGAIGGFRFAYGSDAAALHMQPPPLTLPSEGVGPQVLHLFDRAFGPGSAHSPRPTPLEWYEALQQLDKSLKTCTSFRSHVYFQPMSSCPWCGLLAHSVVLFQLDRTSNTFDLNVFEQSLAQIARPAAYAAPHLGSIAAPSLPPLLHDRSLPWKERSQRAIDLVNTCEQAVESARNRWTSFLQVEWPRAASDQEFVAMRRHIDGLVSQYKHLLNSQATDLQQLALHAREQQFQDYLQNHLVRPSVVPGIGQQRATTLRLYGILTAADVTQSALSFIPGIGPGLSGQLVYWRRGLENNFHYVPGQPLSPAAQSRVTQQYLPKIVSLEGQMGAAFGELTNLCTEITARREAAYSEAGQLAVNFATAEAKLAAARRAKQEVDADKPPRLQQLRNALSSSPSLPASPAIAGSGASSAPAQPLAPLAPPPTLKPPAQPRAAHRSILTRWALLALLLLAAGMVLFLVANRVQVRKDQQQIMNQLAGTATVTAMQATDVAETPATTPSATISPTQPTATFQSVILPTVTPKPPSQKPIELEATTTPAQRITQNMTKAVTSLPLQTSNPALEP
jgi:DNA-binding helix-hairpin-helix protein with protein kinase domain